MNNNFMKLPMITKDLSTSSQNWILTKNISLKRTAKTNTIKQLELVLGKTAKNNIQKNYPVLTKDIE